MKNIMEVDDIIKLQMLQMELLRDAVNGQK